MDLPIEQISDEEAVDMDVHNFSKSFSKSVKENVKELKHQSDSKSSQESDVDRVLNSLGSSPENQSVIESTIQSNGKSSVSDSELMDDEDEFYLIDSQNFDDGSQASQITSQISNHSDQSNNQENQTLPNPSLLLTNPIFKLPTTVTAYLKTKGIHSLFQWQYDCLTSHPDVLAGTKNLVFSAPTSAGKSIIPDILLHSQLITKETKKKVLIVLPYISLANEKLQHLQGMFKFCNFKMGGFMGNSLPSGGFPAMDIAICTIEKANNIVNKMVKENKLIDLGMIIVDELHEIGTSDRGNLIEQMLTKIVYSKKKTPEIDLQIIGMSATLPNLPELASWLDAQLFQTDYRPVPLEEMIKIGNEIKSVPDLQVIRTVDDLKIKWGADSSHLLALTLETVLEGHSALVFCGSKKDCEQYADKLADKITQIIACNLLNVTSNENVRRNLEKAQEILKKEVLKNDGAAQLEIQEQLSKTSANLDAILKRTLLSAVAYHNGNLTMDEREIIESGFKDGHIRVIFCTPTLASGVNLPGK